MLSDLLNTNEVKNALGSEVEFERIETNGRSTTFAKVNEDFALPERIKVQHRESGSGAETVRRSNILITDVIACSSGANRPISLSITMTIPVGDVPLASTKPKDVLAKGMSFLASTGADTTIKFDCSGNGAKTLLGGTL